MKRVFNHTKETTMKKILIATAVASILAGCASTGIIPADRDTYLVSQTWAPFGFQAPTHATATVYQQAHDFCAQRGLQVETVSLDQVPSALGRPTSATLQFRCTGEAGQAFVKPASGVGEITGIAVSTYHQ